MGTVSSGWLARVWSLRVTLGYALLVGAVSWAMVQMTPGVQAAVIRHASTNLHNLGHGRIGTLLGSAFVADAGPVYLWLPGLMCLLAAVELAWGSLRAVISIVAGHVGASLIVAAGLVAALRWGWVAPAVVHASDVGISYVAMAALGALTAAVPRRWRAAWTGWWVAAAIMVVASGPDFTDVGHVVALTLGMAVSARFGHSRPWTVPRVVVSVLGAAFGFMVLTEGAAMPFTAAWGVLGAVAGLGLLRPRARSVSG